LDAGIVQVMHVFIRMKFKFSFTKCHELLMLNVRHFCLIYRGSIFLYTKRI